MNEMMPQIDEEQVIEALAEVEQQQVIAHSAENYNLLEKMEDAHALEIGKEIANGFDDDEETREEWLEDHTFWLSLYMQKDYAETSDPERDWGATESLPILTEACDQFQSRTYKTFFPNETFVSAIPMRRRKDNREEEEDRAKRIGDHMSYQLGFKDRGYKSDKDALFLGTAVHGSFFTKTYPCFAKPYSSSMKYQPKIDNVRPTDLVVNYNVGPCRIEDLRRKTHIIYTTVGETQDLVNKGYFIQPASPALADQGKTAYNVKVDESQGLNPTGRSRIKRDAPAVLYEQHFYLDLDDKGEYRPYIGTICAASKKLLRLTIGYEADPMGNPLKDYEQVQYFTHYKFKNNPDGFYGLGLGHTLADLNSAVNIMLRQTIDAGTLANDGNMSGFISERLGIEGDDVRMILGKLRKIEDSAGDMQNGIMLMKFPGPNSSLVQLMEMMDLRAQRLGSTTEATTGTPSRAEQATTYLAQIEQAMETFSSVQMRLANSFGEELQKVYALNQRYLPVVDYYVVNNEPEQITRMDYADDMIIQPIFDPKFATQTQKITRAQAELNGTLQNPVNQGRPEAYDAAFRRYFEAMDVQDIDELIPPPPQMENFDDQITENMFFLMPKESRPLFDVFPDQDHRKHLMDMIAFVDQFGDTLQPDQQEDIMKHKMKHEAYLYGQEHGIVPPTGQVPTPPLSERQGDEMADSGIAQNLPEASGVSPTQDTRSGMGGGGSAAGFGENQ